ncbi:nuclease harbi1-related [Anaeramoeba ignava]|uniref:Nuclease harbi1-related n=1 Tax=Anaeramoeba ignava TaxID=1746090 RepID=A0A9Q0RG82_ANAIG|nr:nuclease harbi1-related [Anaeramoeba ignava]
MNHWKKNWNFQINLIRAIDGTEHPRDRLVVKESTYHTGKKKFSTLMSLAICDFKGKLIAFETGIDGQNNDSGAYKIREMKKKVKASGYKLLVDGEFGEKEMIKPFQKKNQERLSQIEWETKQKQCITRSVIENVFAYMKKYKVAKYQVKISVKLQTRALKSIAVCYQIQKT